MTEKKGKGVQTREEIGLFSQRHTRAQNNGKKKKQHGGAVRVKEERGKITKKLRRALEKTTKKNSQRTTIWRKTEAITSKNRRTLVTKMRAAFPHTAR